MGGGATGLAGLVPEEVLGRAGQLFRHILATFEVRDWSLLVGS